MKHAFHRQVRSLVLGVGIVCLFFSVISTGPSGADPSLPYFPTATPLLQQVGATQVEPAGMSCPSANNCVVVGDSSDGSTTSALIQEEVDGIWGTPISVSYQSSNVTTLSAVSCSSVGNCTAIGYYELQSTDYPIGISETNGQWDPSPTALLTGTTGYTYTFTSVSCWAPGNCTAQGNEINGTESEISLAQSGGNWAPLPVVLPVSSVYLDAFSSISCSSAGNCTAVGYLAQTAPYNEIVMTEVGGNWVSPTILPTPAGYSDFWLLGVSCPSQGNCTAVGAASTDQQVTASVLGAPLLRDDAAVVSEVGGQWGAFQVLTASSSNLLNVLISISCVAPGTCTAVGVTEPSVPVGAPTIDGTKALAPAPYLGSPQPTDPIYVSSQGGTWGPIQTTAPENNFLIGIACATSSACTTVGGLDNYIYVSSSLPQLTLSTPNSAPVPGVAYVGQLTATGGVGPYTYSIASGTLPPGLSLNPSTGTITGTPTSRGTFAISFMATDASNPNQMATTTVTWNVDALAATGFDVLPLTAASMVAFATGLSLMALVRRRRASAVLLSQSTTNRSA